MKLLKVYMALITVPITDTQSTQLYSLRSVRCNSTAYWSNVATVCILIFSNYL